MEDVIKLGVLFSAVNNTTPTFNQLGKNIDKINKKSSNFRQNWSNLSQRTNSLASFGVIGVGYASSKYLQLGANLEKTRIAFKVFMGDAEKGNEMFKALNDFSDKTPFMNSEVIQAGRSLLSAGIKDVELMKTSLSEIGNVAAGMDIPLQELARIYGRFKTVDIIQAEELNQLNDRGIPIIQELAKVLGVNKDQVKKMGSESKIRFSHMQEAFKNMSAEGGKFSGLMDELSKSSAGKWSTMMGKFNNSIALASEKLMPMASRILDVGVSIVSVIGDLVAKSDSLSYVLSGLVVGFPALYLGAKVFFLLKDGVKVFNSGIIAATQRLTRLLTVQKLANSGLQNYGHGIYGATRKTKALSSSTKMATISQLGFNASLLANPYVMIGAGIAIMAGATYNYYRKVKALTSQKEILRGVEEETLKSSVRERAELKLLFDRIKKTNSGSKERIELAQKIADVTKDQTVKNKLAKASMDDLVKMEGNLIEKVKNRIRARILMEKIEKNAERQVELEDELKAKENIDYNDPMAAMSGLETGAYTQAEELELNRTRQQASILMKQLKSINNNSTTVINNSPSITVNGDVNSETKRNIETAVISGNDDMFRQMKERERLENNRKQHAFIGFNKNWQRKVRGFYDEL